MARSAGVVLQGAQGKALSASCGLGIDELTPSLIKGTQCMLGMYALTTPRAAPSNSQQIGLLRAVLGRTTVS